MDLITLDMETYYANDYTLSRLTTEAYVRDPRFEAILCGFKVNDQPAYWVDAPDIPRELARLDIGNNAVLCHHAHFDGLILSHVYGVTPKAWFDTLSMARGALGQKVKMGLAALAERFGLGQKGVEVELAKGKRRRDFGGSDLMRYGEYCVNDVELTYRIFQKLLPAFQKSELKIVDMVIRMFTEPSLYLDSEILSEYVGDIRADKTGALLRAGIQLPDVMSNDKFAVALENLGVVPPTKISPATGKETWAFAKTDPGMEALAEHPDEDVQALVAARLKNKTTLAETRGVRLIDMATRGAAPVYLKYSGAEQTHRLSGGDKMNWQNMGRGSKLRQAVISHPDDAIVVGDSSNIESRVLDWLAGQNDAVEVYRKADAKLGPDAYCVMAERIYHRTITKDNDPDERQMGKVAKLGLGYAMGHVKFVQTVRVMAKKKITEQESRHIVMVYRDTHPMVMDLHQRAEKALGFIAKGVEGVSVDFRGVIKTCAEGLLLPNGMKIKFPDLQKDKDGWSYWDGRSRVRIYGGKVVENCLGGGTQVATSRGWVPIELVRDSDLVYDGVDFVPHGGVVFKSIQPCRQIDGVRMTDDHEVLTDEGWTTALEEPKPRRADVWCADGATPSGVEWKEDVMGVLLPLWTDRDQDGHRRDQGGEAGRHTELRVHEQTAGGREEQDTRHDEAPGVLGVAKYAGPVSVADTSGVPQLRSAGHCGLRSVGSVPPVLEGYGADVPSGIDAGAGGQQQGVLPRELYLGDPQGAGKEPAQQLGGGHSSAVCAYGHPKVDPVLPAEPWPVFDILNCGPRSRFVVMGEAGPFIVHNCVQALARIIVLDQTLNINVHMPVVLSVHDEAAGITAADEAKDALSFTLECMRVPPVWAPDMPLNSEGGFHQSYGKAKK